MMRNYKPCVLRQFSTAMVLAHELWTGTLIQSARMTGMQPILSKNIDAGGIGCLGFGRLRWIDGDKFINQTGDKLFFH